ncbi:unannotated protein [freshwater metagenome]|uniref:Unannotated protein n=1 Tax=freshwater metagenome TaxID=449393 RepID=A0A6J7AEW2_9ZZZZ
MPGPPGWSNNTSTALTVGSLSAGLSIPGCKRNSAGCVISPRDHGISNTIGANRASASRRITSHELSPVLKISSTPNAVPRATAISHVKGSTAASAARSSAVPAARRKVPRLPTIRTNDLTTNGNKMAAMTVPIRPLERAPVSAGTSAYAAAAQIRTARPAISPRVAKYMLHATSGIPSTTMTVTANCALPKSRNARPNINIKYGAAGAMEPGPILCQASL